MKLKKVTSKIILPAVNTDYGAEVRLMLAECMPPTYVGQYSLEEAKKCLEWMDKVLKNRLRHRPDLFSAPNAKNLTDIIRAHKPTTQFRGFGHYPKIDKADVRQRIKDCVNFANNQNKFRNDFQNFINAAKNAARDEIEDPSLNKGILLAWLTNGSDPHKYLGPKAIFLETILGNDFYYYLPKDLK